MADIQSYERVLKSHKKSRGAVSKLAIILCVTSLLGVWIYASVAMKLDPAWIVLVPLLLITAFFILRKYSQIEHEYAFTAGYLTYSKIYGKSRRKSVCEVDLRTVTEVFPYNNDTAKRLIGDLTVINALPHSDTKNPCVCVYEENEKPIYLIFDCDAQTAKIFKHFNPRATNRAILERLKDTWGENGALDNN